MNLPIYSVHKCRTNRVQIGANLECMIKNRVIDELWRIWFLLKPLKLMTYTEILKLIF